MHAGYTHESTVCNGHNRGLPVDSVDNNRYLHCAFELDHDIVVQFQRVDDDVAVKQSKVKLISADNPVLARGVRNRLSTNIWLSLDLKPSEGPRMKPDLSCLSSVSDPGYASHMSTCALGSTCASSRSSVQTALVPVVVKLPTTLWWEGHQNLNQKLGKA